MKDLKEFVAESATHVRGFEVHGGDLVNWIVYYVPDPNGVSSPPYTLVSARHDGKWNVWELTSPGQALEAIVDVDNTSAVVAGLSELVPQVEARISLQITGFDGGVDQVIDALQNWLKGQNAVHGNSPEPWGVTAEIKAIEF